MPFRVPAVWASLYFALQSFIDSADAGVSEQISSVAKADADKSVADADMRELRRCGAVCPTMSRDYWAEYAYLETRSGWIMRRS